MTLQEKQRSRKGRRLMKKVSELSTLCGVEATAIIYSPYDSQPEVWPSPLGAQRVVAEFKKKPEIEQSKKMVNQESFLKQRLAKAEEQLTKQQKDNREKEITQLMYHSLTARKGLLQLRGLSMVDLNDLGWLIDQNLKEIHKWMETLNQQSSAARPQEAAVLRNREMNVEEEEEEEKPAAEVVQQNHQLLMELLNSNEHTGFGGEEMTMQLQLQPFGFGGNYNHNDFLWSYAFFP